MNAIVKYGFYNSDENLHDDDDSSALNNDKRLESSYIWRFKSSDDNLAPGAPVFRKKKGDFSRRRRNFMGRLGGLIPVLPVGFNRMA